MSSKKNKNEKYKKQNEKKMDDINISDKEGEIINEIKDDNLLRSEIDSLKNQLSIMQADFINYKNRIEKEKKSSIKFANEELIKEILPILDNFSRALKSNEESSSFKEGIEMIYQNLINLLTKYGLKEINSSSGELFNHNFHNAVMIEDSDLKSGHIIETFETGYTLNDKVIRPSMVKVSK